MSEGAVHLGLTIVAALATMLGLAGLPASAGVTVSKPPDALLAAQAYYDYLQEHAPGAVTPLIRYDSVELPPVNCGAAAKPRVFAILIGASQAGAPFMKLSGPANDLALLATSLSARGVPADAITLLQDGEANRSRLEAAFRDTLARVGCGDRVLVHFGGHAGRPLDFMRAILPEELRARADGVPIQELWYADFLNQDHVASQAIRWTERAGLFLALNQQREGVMELLAVSDLSDFTVALRNRMASAIITLDTSYASLADFAGRQDKAGESDIWSLESSGAEGAKLPLDFAPGVKLLPNRGEFAAFYSSVGDSHSVELAFPNADGSKTVYGVFTLRLATAIQNRDSVTVRALSEALKVSPAGERAADQRYRIEASDPDLVLFGDETKVLPQVDPIQITNPTPKRGAAAIEKAEIDIEGVVNWSVPAKAVLVSGRMAALQADGSFTHKVTLQPGLNTIDVVALTADGRTHERKLELVFEGDRKALEGDGRRYAVVIGNQTYDRKKSGFGELSTPFQDADAVAAILTQKFGFQTDAKLPDGSVVPLLLKDATRRDIETVLYQVGLVAGEKDTVLIYYAGHGIYEERTTIAFWVPSDAQAGVPISYLSASTIAEAVQRMQASKVIVISDSCFSGALLRGGGEADEKIADAERDRVLLSLSQRRSRILISSGNNEPVEDTGGAGHSVFARALLNGLEDMHHDAFSARELFDGYVLPFVLANSSQEPQYRPIERTGHEGGDIVFVRQPAK